MAVYAVVPVKGLNVSKRRLSAVLSVQERRVLTVAMLEDVLTALNASVVHEIVVVSKDSAVREVAGKFGVSYISANKRGLNPAIEEGIEWCSQKKADSVLVLPSDIPLVSSKDVDRIVDLGSDGKTVVLSPSQDGGTNALFLNPPNLIRAHFGPNSFVKHVKEALTKTVNVKIHYSIRTLVDIDSAEDLKKLLEIENSTLSRRFLEQIRLRFSKSDVTFKGAENTKVR
jgi:2-phospho-L-lactate guanylyltransferase